MAQANKARRAKVAKALSIACLTAAIIIAATLFYLYRSISPSPAPAGSGANAVEAILLPSEQTTDDDGFPKVDWQHWQAINPRMVAWITVKDTVINHPVVLAPSDDPDFYLHHDIYNQANPLGTVYIDADSVAQGGLDAKNVVILGHALKAVFAPVAQYTDKAFADEHMTILLQTPTKKMKYTVRFADVVKGTEPNKITDFANDKEFRAWYDMSRSSATMVRDPSTEPSSVVSLITCSYTIWPDNERTVVVASTDAPPATPSPSSTTQKGMTESE